MTNSETESLPEADGHVISLAPKLTSDEACRLHLQLAAVTEPVITLDAARVDFIGASALQVLMSMSKSARQDHRTVILKNPSPAFLTGLSRLGAEAGDVQNSDGIPCL